MLKKQLRFCLLMAFAVLMNCHSMKAQPSSGSWGVGIQFGEPSGLSIKHYNPGAMSFDALLAWDLDDFLFINVHGLWEKRLGSSVPLNFYYGPGAFIGIIDRGPKRFFNDSDEEIALGISGTAGLNYYIDQFEIYQQLTPRLQLLEETDADVGGGLGFRFFFR